MATRDAKENPDSPGCLRTSYNILAANTVEGGKMVAVLTSSTDLRAASDAANLLVKGIIPSGEGTFTATDDTSAPVLSGIAAWMDNDATNPVTALDKCYVKNAYTVCAVAGATHNAIAGTAIKIDATMGVLVFFRYGGERS